MTVGSVLGQRGICHFFPDTSSFSCPCFPTAAQSLHLHNIAGPFRDVCIRGEWNGLCCRNATLARVDADRVILNYSRVIPRTIYCEIGPGTTGVECPGQRIQADRLSIPPQMTSQKPVTTGTDGREVEDTTTSANVWIVIPVVLLGVIMLAVPVLNLWRHRKKRRRMLAWMDMHRVPMQSEIPQSAGLIPQAARPSSLPSGICSNLFNHST
ncbi:uncharacterized protein [Hemitrygon akajei]|uniref:uncharacterized protein isoform X2 n=1 Tax=Hemitrygon akajei TaxID=2704970 RepID=UPI003BF94987